MEKGNPNMEIEPKDTSTRPCQICYSPYRKDIENMVLKQKSTKESCCHQVQCDNGEVSKCYLSEYAEALWKETLQYTQDDDRRCKSS